MSIDEKKIGELTVQIDRDNCISSGNCIKVTPELFEFDDESIAVFAKSAESCTREQVIEACEVCPVDALIVKDSSGEQIVP